MDEVFSQAYGARWAESLKPALLLPPAKVQVQVWPEFHVAEGALPQAYAMDRASLEPVRALELVPGMSYLDLCSAPGGKALVAIGLTAAKITARFNDVSRDRLARLKAVLHDYLPEEIVAQLRITCADGARIGGREPESYDAVLADVPCSAERHHLLANDMAAWSWGGSKRLSVRQHALLCSALDSTRPGGRVVYSTCSLSSLENDGVIKANEKSQRSFRDP